MTKGEHLLTLAEVKDKTETIMEKCVLSDFRVELRKEAIRDVRFIDDNFYKAYESKSEMMMCPAYERPILRVSAIAIRTYIMWKFNLIEEDIQ